MAPSQEIKALVDQMPAADERGMYTHIVVKDPGTDGKNRKLETAPIDKVKIEKAVEEIQKGGRESILGVIDMLVEPGRVQAFLLQELQTAGGKEATAAIGKLLTDDDLSEWAARALVSIGDGAVEQFRAALPQAKGKSRLTVLQNLGVLRDAKSADAMRAALADADREIRLAAARGLANIGDAAAPGLLLKAADGSQGWERIQMTKFCLVLAENLAAAGRKAEAAKIYAHLRDTRKDPTEKHVCEAAARGLAAVK
ncbi:MAG: HEAT repeat domain-containing protein [Planctomycetota bacterium]|nr:HEAT repeat domain-containing protein [Planctomycetota bacterium]